MCFQPNNLVFILCNEFVLTTFLLLCKAATFKVEVYLNNQLSNCELLDEFELAAVRSDCF